MRRLRVLIMLFAAGAMYCQTASLQQSARFEAATLKPGDPSYPMGIGTFFTRPGGRIDAWGCTLEFLLRTAYEVDSYQILEGPNWIRQNPFDLAAVPPPDSKSRSFITRDQKLPPPPEELEMLKNLLGERFQLKVHEEIKDGPVYELTLKSQSSKLTESKDKETRPLIATYQTPVQGMYSWKGTNASMEVLAARLASSLKRRVIDRTGLPGNYDFKVDYEQTPESGNPYSQIVQELGLALVSSKGPTRYLVIDHVENLQQQ